MLAIMLVALLTAPAHASLTVSVTADRNLMVASDDPDSNWGGDVGALQISAPTVSQNWTHETLLGFNTASVKSQFDSYYGAGKWTISWIGIGMGSNYPYAGTQPNNPRWNVISPGLFSFSWLSNDNWDEGTVTWNNLSSLLPGTGSNTEERLGTYYFFGDGSDGFWALSKTYGVVSDILSGSEISIFGEPGDTIAGTVGYLFSGPRRGAPQLIVCAEAAPVPIPPALLLLGSGLAGIGIVRRRILKDNRKGGRQ
jgi:hypothetical protein